jgi:hypothetical protein
MASKTKMIIITSDEDLIRQFSFDKDKQTTSKEYNFDFLTQFFELVRIFILIKNKTKYFYF